MLAIAVATMLVASSGSDFSQPGSLKKEPTRYCRAMVVGASRSSDVLICKTKAQWDDFDSCRGVTRYCTPSQKAALAQKHAAAFALTEDSRIVCRVLKITGSRLASQPTCLSQREWQRMWDNGRET